MVPGPRIDVEVGDKVEVHDHQRPADRHRHPLARHRRAPTTRTASPRSPRTWSRAGETYTYRFTATEPAIGMYHAHAHGEHGRPQRPVRHVLRRRGRRSPTGRTISGIDDPRRPRRSPRTSRWSLNDAGVIGLTLNGKSFPATAPDRRRRGRLGRGHLLQRGPAGRTRCTSTASSRSSYAKDGEPLDQPVRRRHHPRRPRRALHRAGPRRPASGTWVWHCHILNHVESDDRHVRHGHRPRRPAGRRRSRDTSASADTVADA